MRKNFWFTTKWHTAGTISGWWKFFLHKYMPLRRQTTYLSFRHNNTYCYSQAIHGRRICNHPWPLQLHLPWLPSPPSPTPDSSHPSTNPTQTKPVCPLITTYYPGLHSLRHILNESHHILLSDPSTRNLLLCPLSINYSSILTLSSVPPLASYPARDPAVKHAP